MPLQTEARVVEISRIRNPETSYVSIILDCCTGEPDDPATSIKRYIAMFSVDKVPEQLVLGERYYGFELVHAQKVDCLVWEMISEVKKPDREAEQHKQQDESLTRQDRSYGTQGQRQEMYAKFLDAIDRLATNYEDASAWEAIDKWRQYHAEQYER